MSEPARIQPWTIKGVPPEARNAAIAAAERAKQPIGVWVARKLLEAAQADAQAIRALVAPPTPADAPPPAPPPPPLERLAQLAEIATTLAALPDGTPRGFKAAAQRELRRHLRVVE